MDFTDLPHRCPKGGALVVDRRSAVCTTCRAELPKDWVMTPEEVAKLTAIDQEIRADYAKEIETLNASSPWGGPYRWPRG
jgi:hypothetical protein